MVNPLVKEENSTDVAVVMLPFPAQGHINALLHFSGRLVSTFYNLSVYFAGTAVYLRQAKGRVHGWDPSSATNMHFHEFKHNHSTASSISNIPTHLIPLMVATTQIREPVYTFVNELSTKYRKVVVIYDYLMSYLVQDIHSIKNVDAYRFHAVSACDSFCYHRVAQDKVAAAETPPEAAEVLKKNLSSEGLSSPEAFEFCHMQENARKVFSGDIYNSNGEIERSFFDLLEKEKARGAEEVWCLGPFNPVSISEIRVSRSRHESLDWLDKQEPNSVIFVSFGTTSSLSDEQIREIAIGLERSAQKFIWVLRDADRGDVSAHEATKLHKLPLGFEDRLKERGIIPRNAVLITKVLRIGVEILNWERREEIVSADTVERVVRTLMASEKGDEIRERAKEMGNRVKSL
ncbi:hypothetical protein BUALT_Bualt12G0019600 [Buddleja alternifolia]|uniref:Glycosyltransferase N-terminal domain-containing protein n=1 Tax=Buddleja alternifolia TaxID=168488 RepID=A0AAV6WMQ3_9LAMI|nr:hypothetical protein BUALT_Bualt12G0019600 [Buddleja alternifolia]